MIQYIGARYVPIFYQNSLDPTSSEWEPNVTYEPLTWVSLPNGYMYISKKEVPANTGTPASNPQYWFEAGQYNAYIQSLQDQIDDMQDATIPGSLQDQINNNASDISTLNSTVTTLTTTTIPTIQSNITTLNNKVAALEIPKTVKDKHVVFLGDSYGETPGEYPDIIQGIVGFDEYYNICAGSTGFTGKENTQDQSVGLEWKTILSNWVVLQTADTLNGITDVYVVGGFNDNYSTDVATIKTYIEAFMTYATAVLPNAQFHLGFCAWCGPGTITTPTESQPGSVFRARLANKVYVAYSQCLDYGMSFIDGLNVALHNYSVCFMSDNYHPSSTGEKRIARALLNYILGSTANTTYNTVTDGGYNGTKFVLQGAVGDTLFSHVEYNGNEMIVSCYDPVTEYQSYTLANNVPVRTNTLLNNVFESSHVLPVLDGTTYKYLTLPVSINTSSDSWTGYLIVNSQQQAYLYSEKQIVAGTQFWIRLLGHVSFSILGC